MKAEIQIADEIMTLEYIGDLVRVTTRTGPADLPVNMFYDGSDDPQDIIDACAEFLADGLTLPIGEDNRSYSIEYLD